jgi:hypothetical protein
MIHVGLEMKNVKIEETKKVRFEVLTVVSTKMAVLWDVVVPCSLVEERR